VEGELEVLVVVVDANAEKFATDEAVLTTRGLIDGESDDCAALAANEGWSEGVAVDGIDDGVLEVDGTRLTGGFVDGERE
jgi:hypothetical protein